MVGEQRGCAAFDGLDHTPMTDRCSDCRPKDAKEDGECEDHDMQRDTFDASHRIELGFFEVKASR